MVTLKTSWGDQASMPGVQKSIMRMPNLSRHMRVLMMRRQILTSAPSVERPSPLRPSWLIIFLNMGSPCISASTLVVGESTSGPRGKKGTMKKKCQFNKAAVKAPFICEECGRDYWDKRSLDRHTRENHTEEAGERLPCS